MSQFLDVLSHLNRSWILLETFKVDLSRANYVQLIARLMIASFIFTELSCTKKNNEMSSNERVKPIILRLGHDSDETSSVHLSAVNFANRVESASRNRLKIEVYPAQKLGTDHAMIEMARVGELDFILPPTSKLSHISPALQLFDLPFLFDDPGSFQKILEGRVGEKLLATVDDKGLFGIGFWQIGGRHFTSNFPIRSPRDFQLKIIRVMRSPVIIAQFELMGAQSRQIDFYETYNALKDKIIDGQENPLMAIYAQKFYEVQSDLTLSNHAFLVQMFAASSRTMASLPKDLRQIILDEGKEVSRKVSSLALKEEAESLKLLRKTSIKISELSPESRVEFRNAMLDLVYMFEDDIGSNFLKEAVNEAGIAIPKDDSIVVAVDADLSGKSAASGRAIYRGVRLAVNEINSQGGINGKKLRVIAFDHEAVAARSEANLQKLKSRDNVKAIFGGLQSAIIMGEMSTIAELSKLGKIYIVPWASAEAVVHNSLTPNPVFRLSAHDKLTGPFLGKEAARRSRKIALLLENSAWGRGNEESITQALKKLGITPKAVEFFNVGEKEFISLFKRIEDSGAEVVVMVANPGEAKEIVKTLFHRPRRLPIIAHWGFTGGAFGLDLATELQSVDLKFLQTVAFIDNNRPQAKVLARRYLSMFGDKSIIDIEAAAGVARAYDAMRILGFALAAQEKNPKLDLIKAMENVANYDGVIKSYKYPFKERREALDSSVFRLGMYDPRGRIIPVEARH